MRDRSGHRILRALGALALLLVACGTARASGDYKARRFDVDARVVDGNLDVRETVEFAFQTGAFTKVWRDIPLSRTDGVQVIEATMDGWPVTPAAMSGNSRLRVEWNFPPVGPSVHVFTLHYLARGVVYTNGRFDIVRWRALPSEHSYAIDSTRIVVHANAAPIQLPRAETHRAQLSSTQAIEGGIEIEAGSVRSNGWIIAEVRYAAGRIAVSQPRWSTHQAEAAALAPVWALIAGIIFVGAIPVLLIARQGYASPSSRSDETMTTEPPAAVPAAVAAALANNGRNSGQLALATLIDLADRGVLLVTETPRVFGVRQFQLAQVPGSHELEGHESEAIDISFSGSGDPVSLSRARGRLGRGGRRFVAALNADLERHGLLDTERKSLRDRVTYAGVALLIACALACIAAAAFVPKYDGWPFFIPLGFGLAGIVGVIMAASMTPLSDTALVEAARWRGYRRYLKSLAADRDAASPRAIPSRWIIYGVALGLAQQWARYLKRHPAAAPPWFLTLGNDDGAFAAFVGSHAAASSAGAGGAAAGGGASGAA
jgi:hypothetical protein